MMHYEFGCINKAFHSSSILSAFSWQLNDNNNNNNMLHDLRSYQCIMHESYMGYLFAAAYQELITCIVPTAKYVSKFTNQYSVRY